MKELRNEDFRSQYISDKCKGLLGVDIDTKNIEFVDEGVLNFVYRVTTPTGVFYFKQALESAKHHERIGSDLALIPPSRIRCEINVIEKIQSKLPEEIQIPMIIYYDEKNNILMMTDVAGDGELLQNALLAGYFNGGVAKKIGKFLGISHRSTYNQNNVIRGNTEEDRKNWEIFLNMRTQGIQSKKISKGITCELSELFGDVLENYTYDILINMDCCPKNIFQRTDGSIGVIDFELASGVGDPAYDIGFSLGHYFLFSVLSGVPKSSVESIEGMVESYLNEFEPPKLEGFNNRIMKYAGAVLLYRVAGSSPAAYISEEKQKKLIGKGSELLISDNTRLDEVTKILGGG